jgi:hypothetical protein
VTTEDHQRPAASTAGSRPAATPRDERDVEISRLREKLTFYESFDRQVLESVTRSADLLRQAMELRDTASGALSVAREEVEREQFNQRQRQRDLLSDLLDDVIQLQGQAERLARRIADALDEVESDLPAGDFPSASTLLGGAAAFESPAPVTFETETDLRPLDLAEIGPAPAEPTSGAVPAPAPEREAARPTVILIHGLPAASAALSLQRHLSALDHVSVVEPREFANGVLRLLVSANQELTAGDVQAWTQGAHLAPVHVRSDLIEMRYQEAAEDPAEPPASAR